MKPIKASGVDESCTTRAFFAARALGASFFVEVL